jgi:hypothetical protein
MCGYLNKSEYNLMMASIVAETCSWYRSVPLINNIVVLWLMSSTYLLIALDKLNGDDSPQSVSSYFPTFYYDRIFFSACDIVENVK